MIEAIDGLAVSNTTIQQPAAVAAIPSKVKVTLNSMKDCGSLQASPSCHIEGSAD